MVEIAVGSLICLIVAVVCVVVAGIIALWAKIGVEGGVGCFVLAVVFLCILAAALLCAGF